MTWLLIEGDKMKAIRQRIRHSILSALRITSAVLMGVVLSAHFCEAATYYTAKNGNDISPGTEAQPFLTISKGVSILKPGDTLYVKDGTYAESLEEKIPSGTSWENAVAMRAYNGPCKKRCLIYMLSGNQTKSGKTLSIDHWHITI